MVTTNIKTYSEMILLPTFRERFEYLRLDGVVGDYTFAGLRYLNQRFYQSEAWKKVRREIIIRDNGCDLAIEGQEIGRNGIYIHHINPITKEDLIHQRKCVFDPENLVCVGFYTHNAIHYNGEVKEKVVVRRTANDTCPWK